MHMKMIPFEIPKRTDKQIIESMKQIVAEYGTVPTQIRLHLFVDVMIECPFNDIDTHAELNEILSYDSDLVDIFYLDLFIQGQITVHRQTDKLFDRVSISYSQLDQKAYLRLIACAKKWLHAFNDFRSLSRLVDEESKVHYEIREMELERLQQIAEQVTKNSDTYRRDLEESFLKKIADNDNLLAKRINELEVIFRNKEEDLAKQKAVVEEKLKHVDDRENTHARRQIRGELKSELQKRQAKFELTKGTRELRLPIQIFLIFLLIFFGGLLALFSFETYQIIVGSITVSSNVALSIILRQILLTTSFGGTSIYYLKWTNQWFQHHADEEFRTKRFDIDIDRASWVVEMALEWKKEKGTDIPIELLEKLMQNLFVEPATQPELNHPAETLASALLGASSSIKIKTGNGSEIDFDKKGINKVLDSGKN
jgi:hypothetical protein